MAVGLMPVALPEEVGIYGRLPGPYLQRRAQLMWSGTTDAPPDVPPLNHAKLFSPLPEASGMGLHLLSASDQANPLVASPSPPPSNMQDCLAHYLKQVGWASTPKSKWCQ